MLLFDGKITNKNPDDTYTVKFEASKRYVIELTGNGANALTDPFLVLFGEGGEYIEDDNSAGNLASLIQFSPSRTQYYDVSALSADGSKGDYQLTIKIDDYRDTFDGAARIGTVEPDARPIKGKINENGDVDFFEISLVKGLSYDLRLESGPKGTDYVGDPKLTLISGSGRVIASDDDSGSGNSALIQYTAKKNGVYYLRVEPEDVDTGTYLLRSSLGTGSHQQDDIKGTNGSDSMNALSGDDTVDGRDGNDRIWGANGNDKLSGGQGDDMIRGGTGNDRISGGQGNDTLRGEEGQDTVHGGGGSYFNYGDSGEDLLLGKAGNDRIYGGDSADKVEGGIGSDRLYGEDGVDVLIGGEGRDYLNGGQDDDLLRGGADSDSLVGSGGDDELRGGDNNDYLRGDDGDDTLVGGRGDDFLSGADGDDVMDGGSGSDYYYGDRGNDVFVFSDADHSTEKQTDRIGKFDNPGVKSGDVFDLTAVDADSTRRGNQSLVFDSDGTGEKGTIWLEDSNKKNDPSIFIYTNSDDEPGPEMAIDIENWEGRDAADYTADDFLL